MSEEREQYLAYYCADKKCADRNGNECDNCMYEKGRADAIEIWEKHIREDAVKWHYFEDNDFPPNEDEEYLFCYKRPDCKYEVCDKFLECDIFDENCKNYYFYYEINMGGEQNYSDGLEIAWCELPRVAEELKEKE